MVIPLFNHQPERFAPVSSALPQRMTDFTAIAMSMHTNMTDEWRVKLRGMTPLAWTGRICQRVGETPFQPLTTALDAASALMLHAGWTINRLRDEMESAGCLDTLALGPDISRDDPAWAALISSEARNWYDEASFVDAMREVAVWSFRAWAVTLPKPGAVIPLRAG